MGKSWKEGQTKEEDKEKQKRVVVNDLVSDGKSKISAKRFQSEYTECINEELADVSWMRPEFGFLSTILNV